MRERIISIFFLLALCSCCKGQQAAGDDVQPVRIYRFDKDLFRLVETSSASVEGELLCDYPEMLEVIGKGILNIQKIETPGFTERLIGFYSEPTLKRLYIEAINLYDSISDIERELGRGFAYLKEAFPAMPIPKVYMHVSGFNQNVLVADKLLSISIDKYMGKDYPLYRQFFHDYQREKMQRDMIVPDYLAGWLMSEFPFEGKESVLLERMVYEGKIRYLISQALPDLQPKRVVGYSDRSYEWCQRNEGTLWKTIIERKHLYTPDIMTVNRYFDDLPSTFVMDEAPGSIGTWLGLQIVKKYVSETGSTPEFLMKNTDAQDILAKSKYKPF